MSYPDTVNPVRIAIDKTKALVGICRDEHLLVLNNPKTFTDHYKGELTYRQGQLWVSELDACLYCMLSFVSNFVVH